HERRRKPAGPLPQAVAVGVDGGCLQTRAAGHGPGVHEQGWKEDKVACLHTLAGPTFANDPHPDPPACFLDPPYVEELVQDLKSHKRLGDEDDPADGATEPAGDVTLAPADGALLPLEPAATLPTVEPPAASIPTDADAPAGPTTA